MPTDVGSRVPLFAGLADETLADVTRHLRPRQFAAREVICRAGEPGTSLFVIERGLALVLPTPSAGRTPDEGTVARLRRGDVVGEMALLTGEPRSATVVAAVPTTVLELDREWFAAVVARYPDLLLNLGRILSRRLQRTTAAHLHRPARGEAIGLVVDRRGAALLPSLLTATAATAPRGAIAIDLTGTCPPGPLVTTPDDRSVAGALALLDDLLPRYGAVLIAVDLGQDQLPALLEQTDRDLALLGGTDAERLAGLSRDATAGMEIALIGDERVNGVAAVAGAPVIRTVAAGKPGQGVAWLGRHLARTKLGLALGAGGAKGYAHVATLQVLEAAGYTVDAVAGSSIGAMVGAWYGLGQNGAAVEATMRGAFSPETVAAMFKLSLSGLSSGLDAHRRLLRDTTADRTFADLRVPLVAMTIDLDARRPCPLTDGPLWEALMAATALPGLFPPHTRDGRRLVDGLCLVPVPSEAARTAGADVVVSANLISRDTLPAWPGDPPPPPAPVKPRVRMLDTLLETIDLAQLDASVRHAALADVVVTPRFGPSTWREFDQADRFLAAGRLAAEEQLPALRHLAKPQPMA